MEACASTSSLISVSEQEDHDQIQDQQSSANIQNDPFELHAAQLGNKISEHALKFFIGFLCLVIFSLSIVVWSQRNKDFHCQECNCDVQNDLQQPVEQQLGEGLAFITTTLILCSLGCLAMLHYRVIVLPLCIIYIFIGLIVGIVLRFAGGSEAAGKALPNTEQFLLFILPPIIFEAGYSLNKVEFFRTLSITSVYAILGTFISALVFGGGLYLMGILGVSYLFTIWESFTFGALISSVDPVATLAIFKALKIDKELHFLVFGESVLNDMVAILLNNAFRYMSLKALESFSAPIGISWLYPFWSFLKISVGSTTVGLITSIGGTLCLKLLPLFTQPTLELSFFFLVAYLPYFICEGMEMSGIVGIFVSSIALSHYAYRNLSPEGKVSANTLTNMVSYIAETFVFVYLGVAFVVFNHKWYPTTILWSTLFMLLSRACNIFPLSLIINVFSPGRVPAKQQFIMWFSGLRGAISFALSLNFASIHEETRRVVVSTTLSLILFSIIFLGGGTLPVLKLLGMSHHEDISSAENNDEQNNRNENSMKTNAENGTERIPGNMTRSPTNDLFDIQREMAAEASAADHGFRGAFAAAFQGEATFEENVNALMRLDKYVVQPFLVHTDSRLNQPRRESGDE